MYLHVNFIPPIVFEIFLRNPTIWLAKNIFAFKHAHLKLQDQFAALIDMKFHGQNQIYTSISFWDIKACVKLFFINFLFLTKW